MGNMSVEIVGPLGYEYQYLVTLMFALEVIEKENIEIYIEDVNGEDSTIKFTENGEQYTIDLQVKMRDQQIDISEFSNWISHFQKRSWTKNLLTKLMDEKNRFALFVTNSRCMDEVSMHVDSKEVHRPLNININEEKLDLIKISVLNSFPQESKLKAKRRNHLEDFFSNVTKQELRTILKKNKIWDLQNPEIVYEKISRNLNKKFYVPQSETENVVRELLDIIREGRDGGKSISLLLVELLARFSGVRVFEYDSRMINREEKERCSQIFEENHVLLLTGVSLCGKTYLAKDIAQKYQDCGFKVHITSELYGDSGALSFFRHISHEDRLLILEDPYGQVITNDKSVELISVVRKIVDDSEGHRKVIITSRNDILLDAMNKNSLAECKIGNNDWIDLTVHDSHLSEGIWHSYFGKTIESTNVLNKLRSWLRKNERINNLQPGQIVHLFNSDSDLMQLNKMDEASVVDLARVDSDQLAQKIINRGPSCKKVYVALGLACNTYRSVKIEDLAFILSESTELPSVDMTRKRLNSIDYFIEEDSEEESSISPYPNYNETKNINDDYQKEIRYLWRHGYIKVEQLNRQVSFTHPIYHHASTILFQSSMDDIFEKEDTLSIARRSLSALSKGANICTLMMLERNYLENKNKEIKQIMLLSLYSIYPSVKDRLIMFFGSRVTELDNGEQTELVQSIRSQESIRNKGILWHNGEPYFNTSKNRGFTMLGYLKQRKKNTNELEKIIGIFNGGEYVTSEEIWNAINSEESQIKNPLYLEIINKALTYDESFIREEAIYYLFQYHAYNFNDISIYLDIQEHPNYVFKLFKGALSTWSKYQPSVKREILEYFKSSLNVMSVVIRSVRFLENFEEEIDWEDLDHGQVCDLWSVWYEVFIELLNKFPSKFIQMDEPNMVNVTETSLKFITDPMKVVALASAWVNWLDAYSTHHYADDYGMSVVQYLMDGTKDQSELRRDIFDRLLSVSKTSFMTTNIKNFVDDWEYLSGYEKKHIIDLLNSEREDLKWLRAVVLNRDSIPREIEMSIFRKVLSEQNIDVIVDTLIDKQLLEPCLNVHCGYPQPLWWNGYHHNNYELWDPVILEVLMRECFDRSFEISLREFVDSLYNKSQRFPNGIEIYVKLLNEGSKKRDLIFNRLFHETISQNQANKKLWDHLFENCSKDEMDNYISKIVDLIEGVQYHHMSYKDLYELFDSKIIFQEIYPRLEIDKKLLYICNMHYELEDMKNRFGIEVQDEETREGMSTLIQSIYESTPPRLSLTNKMVLHLMEKLGVVNKELNRLIEKNRKRLVGIGSNINTQFNDHYKLENWIE